MATLITVIHVLVAVILILIVLLQSGKGADMGAAFGGASQTLFGTGGAATFLSKLTVAAAVIFMITSLSLTVLSRSRTSVMPGEVKTNVDVPQQKEATPAAQAPAPATEENAAKQ